VGITDAKRWATRQQKDQKEKKDKDTSAKDKKEQKDKSKEKADKQQPQTVVTASSDQTHPSATTVVVTHREIVYTAGTLSPDGKFCPERGDTITLSETQVGGNSKPTICSPSCTEKGQITDEIEVANTKSTFQVEQKFDVNGASAKIASRGKDGNITLSSKQTVDANATTITITPVP
jgi:hypothetical protein